MLCYRYYLGRSCNPLLLEGNEKFRKVQNSFYIGNRVHSPDYLYYLYTDPLNTLVQILLEAGDGFHQMVTFSAVFIFAYYADILTGRRL